MLLMFLCETGWFSSTSGSNTVGGNNAQKIFDKYNNLRLLGSKYTWFSVCGNHLLPCKFKVVTAFFAGVGFNVEESVFESSFRLRNLCSAVRTLSHVMPRDGTVR